MDYKGVKISDKIIIVARHIFPTDYKKTLNLIPQGYVVDKGNKKMLETALNWAERKQYDMTLSTWEERQKTEQIIPGDQFEYLNGQFTITLCESADYSSQGGKLSFWDCLITAADGKKFIIGINSELLLHLLKSNTLVNGECKNKVWLGRVKGNQVGAFTENMEEFKQAKLDATARNTKKSTVYEAGTLVETLTTKDLYLGEMYLYGKRLTVRPLKLWAESKDENYLVFYNKPKKVYAYLSIYNSYRDNKPTYNSCITLSLKKLPRIVSTLKDINKVTEVKNLVDGFSTSINNLKCKVTEADKYSHDYFYTGYWNIFISTQDNLSKLNLFNVAKLFNARSDIKYKIVREEELPDYCKEKWEELNSKVYSNKFAYFDLGYTKYLLK